MSLGKKDNKLKTIDAIVKEIDNGFVTSVTEESINKICTIISFGDILDKNLHISVEEARNESIKKTQNNKLSSENKQNFKNKLTKISSIEDNKISSLSEELCKVSF